MHPFILTIIFVFLAILGWVNPSVASLTTASKAMAPDRETPTSPQGTAQTDIRGLARMGLLDSALELSLKLLADNPKNLSAQFMVAKLSPEGKRSGELFQKIVQGEGQGPEVEESYFRLGQYYYAAGKYYLAIPSFRNYLDRFPSGDWKAPARYWMGNACLAFAKSNPDKGAYLDTALIYLQTFTDSESTDDYYLPLAWEGQAKVRMAQGNREAAWTAAAKALAKAPEEERSALLLLSAQIRQGENRKEEKSLLEQLLKQFPASPEARYLRQLNRGIAPDRWKSGSGFPKGLAPAVKDSLPVDLPTVGPQVQPPAPTANPTHQGEFTLQLGAFSQESNAKAIFEAVTSLGFQPEIVESSRNGKPFFQVRLGKFKNPEAASEYARKNLKPHQVLSQPVPLTR